MKRVKPYQLIVIVSLFVLLLFFSLFFYNHFSNLFFVGMGIFVLAILFGCLKMVLDIFGNNDGDSTKNYIMTIFLLSGMVLYVYINYAADTVKVWDYACYYRLALNFKGAFSESLLSGLRHVVRTIWYDEYNCFLLLFTIFPFELTSKSFESYFNSFTLTFVMVSCYLFMCIAKRLVREMKGQEDQANNILFGTMCLTIISFPLLHAAATKGMPDVGGLIFIVAIFMLCYDYDFQDIEMKRLCMLGLASICLFIFRRWYTFWIVGFYVSYFAYCLWHAFRLKQGKKVIRNIVLFAVIMVGVVGFSFHPMLIRILKSNINNVYSAWNYGGIKYELGNQYRKLGLILSSLIIVGCAYGLLDKKSRKGTILFCGSSLISFVLFTRVQNMGIHQSLLLVPAYVWGLFMCIGLIRKTQKVFIAYVFAGVLCLNMLGSITNSAHLYNCLLWGNVSIKPEIRKDLQLIEQVNDFLSENGSEEREAYLNLGSGEYNPEVFKNKDLPDQSLYLIIMSEHSVDLTHGFPTEFFEATYVITASPLQEGRYSEPQLLIRGIDEALRAENVVSKKFNLVKTIENADICFYVYERTEGVDGSELDYFKEVFAKYYNQYPELYRDRVERYR